MKKLLLLTTFALILLAQSQITRASCGMFINYIGYGDDVPVENCDDPFYSIGFISDFYINNELIEDGDVIYVTEPITRYEYKGDDYDNYDIYIYKHVGQDFILQNTDFSDTTHDQYLSVLHQFFPDNHERAEFYAEIFASEGDVEYLYEIDPETGYSTNIKLLDPFTGEYVANTYWSLNDEIWDYIEYFRQPLDYGTYTAEVFVSEGGPNPDGPGFSMQEKGLFQSFFAYFVPTAYASLDQTAKTITFTIAPPSEITGASSVLFLPGIQSSRLYQKNILGFEDELWVPTHNGDVRQLAMTATGESENDIYTREIVDSVTGLGTVYAGISNYFDTLVAEDKIADWEPFAYDWRYSVDEIVTNGTLHETERKYVLDLIETMAEESDTGKVSLVGHSNGGLLAKMIVSELEELGKEDLIDQVVLLASPQTGTPKAIGSLLHGYGQEIVGGLILQADTAREVIQNLPGAYALLPTKEYFEDTGGAPVVVFEDFESTQAFIDVHGSQITDVDTLRDFMTGWGEDRAKAQSVYEPIIANYGILVDTANLHTNVLQAWRAPDGVKVTEVAGIGLPTIHSFAYRAYMKRDCALALCPSTLHYKPVPQVSLLGDETVMTTSAVGYRGEKESYYFNLDEYKDIQNIQHYNFTEAESVHSLLSNLLFSATNTTPFITKVAPSPSDSYMMMGVHSPVTATVTDGEGRQIKVEYVGDFIKKTEDIPGAYVSYFGETTYMILPKDGDYQVELSGTGSGSVTLELDNLDGESSQTTTRSVLIDSVSTSTMMTTTLTDSVMSDVLVDEDGDGEVDKQIDAETNEILELNTSVPVEEVDNSSSGSGGGSGARRSSLTPQVAGAQISLEGGENIEYYLKLYELLLELRRLLLLYEQIN